MLDHPPQKRDTNFRGKLAIRFNILSVSYLSFRAEYGSRIPASECQDSNTKNDHNDQEHPDPPESAHSPTHSVKTAHRVSPLEFSLARSSMCRCVAGALAVIVRESG